MSRRPKKRNKQYRGEDASEAPKVHRYTAVVRSPFGEWWTDNKRKVKNVSITTAVVAITAYLLTELFFLVF